MTTTEPVLVPAEAEADERLIWIGEDDRGIELEVVALVLTDAFVVIHVMPTALRGSP
jgi:phage gp46-like protein